MKLVLVVVVCSSTGYPLLCLMLVVMLVSVVSLDHGNGKERKEGRKKKRETLYIEKIIA